MCVFLVSKKGVKPPTDDELKKMWERNPDGAGMIWDLGKGLIEYHKGFMEWNEFIKKWHHYQQKYDMVNRAVGFHFRIKTSGKVDPGTCHPFRLTSNYKKLRQTDYIGHQPVMLHNGVISELGGWIDKNSSDTQDFAATFGKSMLTKPSKTKKKAIEKVLDKSRIAVFYGNNEPEIIGDTQEYNENIYSNLLWKPSSCVYKDEIELTKDPEWLAGEEWVYFSTEEKRDKAFQYYTKYTSRDGVKYQNVSGKCFAQDAHDPLEYYTKKGWEEKEKQKYLEYDYYGYYDEDDAEDMLYVDTTDDLYDDIIQEIEIKNEKTYYCGEEVFIDYENQVIYNTAALKFEFGDYWKQARYDIRRHKSFIYNWTDEPENEKKALERDIKVHKKQLRLEGGTK